MKSEVDCSLVKALLRAPTGGAGPSTVAVGKETWPLSFKMIIRFVSRQPALFNASYAIPAVMAPSPITEITWLFFPNKSLATAIPEENKKEERDVRKFYLFFPFFFWYY